MSAAESAAGGRGPVTILTPSVVVSARVASKLAGPLAELLRRYRVVDGGVPDAELTATIEAIGALGRAWRESRTPSRAEDGTRGIPHDVPSAMLGAVPVAAAARHLGTTERAVRARCQRGSLPAVKSGGSWFVYLDEHLDERTR